MVQEIPLETLQLLARAAAQCAPHSEARERVWLALERLLDERPLESFGSTLQAVARSHG